MPVALLPGDRVLSGSVNGVTTTLITATAVAKDSPFRAIVALVESAASHRAPVVRLADRYAVPFAVLSLPIGGPALAVSADAVRFADVLVLVTRCPWFSLHRWRSSAGSSRSTSPSTDGSRERSGEPTRCVTAPAPRSSPSRSLVCGTPACSPGMPPPPRLGLPERAAFPNSPTTACPWTRSRPSGRSPSARAHGGRRGQRCAGARSGGCRHRDGRARSDGGERVCCRGDPPRRRLPGRADRCRDSAPKPDPLPRVRNEFEGAPS